MQVKINLATRSYIDTARLNAAIVAAIVIFAALLFFQTRNVADNAGEIRRLNQETTQLAGKAKGEIPPKDYQGLLTKIKFANDVITRKTFNWLILLDKLEGVVSDGIALTAIEPTDKGKNLKISGVAKSFANVRKLVENMEESKDFSEVFLLGQAEVKSGATQKGTSFTITCKVNSNVR